MTFKGAIEANTANKSAQNQHRCKCIEDGIIIIIVNCEFRVTTDNFQPTSAASHDQSNVSLAMQCWIVRFTLLVEPTVQPGWNTNK